MTFPRIGGGRDDTRWPWCHRRTFMERLTAQGYSRCTLREYQSIADAFCVAIEKRALRAGDLDCAITERLRQAVLRETPRIRSHLWQVLPAAIHRASGRGGCGSGTGAAREKTDRARSAA
jgi:hypothetical protein